MVKPPSRRPGNWRVERTDDGGDVGLEEAVAADQQGQAAVRRPSVLGDHQHGLARGHEQAAENRPPAARPAADRPTARRKKASCRPAPCRRHRRRRRCCRRSPRNPWSCRRSAGPACRSRRTAPTSRRRRACTDRRDDRRELPMRPKCSASIDFSTRLSSADPRPRPWKSAFVTGRQYPGREALGLSGLPGGMAGQVVPVEREAGLKYALLHELSRRRVAHVDRRGRIGPGSTSERSRDAPARRTSRPACSCGNRPGRRSDGICWRNPARCAPRAAEAPGIFPPGPTTAGPNLGRGLP